ncbi:MAG: hypothetical protein IKD37_07565 [Clostridia bacterium]|nr:hypothetical protein [Clostridia bacterium]
MTRTRNSIAIFLLLALLLGSFTLPAAAAESGLLTGGSSGAALEAGRIGQIPFTLAYPTTPIYPGFTFSPDSGLPIPIAPTQSGIITQMTATLNLPTSSPLSLYGTGTLQFGQLLRGGAVNGAFEVAVAEDARPATYSVSVDVSYTYYAYVANSDSPFGSSLSSTPSTGSLSFEIPVTVLNPEYEALTAKSVFSVVSRDIPDRVTAGDSFTASVTVRNSTAYRLEDVTVTLDAPNCYFEDDTNVKRLSINARGTARAAFRLKAASTASVGSHQVRATVSYRNPAGETVSEEFYMLLNISAAASALPADVQIVELKLPDAARAGDTLTASVTVKNNSTDRTAESITLSLAESGSLQLRSADKLVIPTLAPGQSATLTVDYAAPANAASAYCVFTAKVSFTTAGQANTETRSLQGGFYLTAREMPSVEITAFTLPSAIKAGETFTATVTVKNTSADQAATALNLSLSQQSGLLTRSATKLTVPTLAPGEEKTLTVTYAAPHDAEDAYCLFTASYTYTAEGLGRSETRSQDNGTYLTAKEQPALELTGISIPAEVNAETDFTITATVRNNGGPAENLYFSIEPDAGFVYKSSTAKLIKSLGKGESTTLSFKLYGSETISEGYKSIRLTCTADGKALLEEYTGTNILVPEKKNTDKNDVPVIIISSYDYGESVFGGQTFTLNLTFRNTSKTTGAKDLKITVSSSSGDGVTAFTPANSSNTFFIESLAPQETVTQSIDLLVKGDLAPKSYGIFVHLEYKNESGTAGDSADETLAIPVKQEVRFNIGEISSLTDITTMEEAYLTATFGNLGKSPIYNVIVKVTGEGFSCYSPEYYAGNIEAGKHISYDFYLMPNGPGFATGTLTYSYEDANGEQFTETQEFSFNIMESQMNMGGMGGMIEMPMEPIFDEETGYFIDPMTGEYLDPETMMPVDPSQLEGGFKMPIWGWCAIGGGALAVLIVVIVLVRRAKKRKQEEDDADL